MLDELRELDELRLDAELAELSVLSELGDDDDAELRLEGLLVDEVLTDDADDVDELLRLDGDDWLLLEAELTELRLLSDEAELSVLSVLRLLRELAEDVDDELTLERLLVDDEEPLEADDCDELLKLD